MMAGQNSRPLNVPEIKQKVCARPVKFLSCEIMHHFTGTAKRTRRRRDLIGWVHVGLLALLNVAQQPPQGIQPGLLITLPAPRLSPLCPISAIIYKTLALLA